jgi:aspartate/tyrosine/aromatic aminotransferase
MSTFFKQFRPSAIYQSAPTWGNHGQMFNAAGLTVRNYRYYDAKTRGFNFKGMVEDLANAPAGSIILLHTCAHNPTGGDPTPEQWHAIADVIAARGHFPFFDTAYQGFASGDLQKDGYGLRYFANQGFQMCVAQSFAKIMGLYGERTGCIHFVCKDKETAGLVQGQIKRIVRSNYSSPPINGARIAARIINTPEYYKEWRSDLSKATVRMNDMRQLLRAELEKIGTKGDWSHVTTQIGMFTFTGLTTKQSVTMVEKHHIYMTKNGRISIAGLTKANIPYVAACFKDVVDNY